MATGLRIGIVGCGLAARVHLARLLAIEGVRIVGCADPDLDAAQTLAAVASSDDGPVPAFADHRELIARAGLEALAIFTPHRAHYRPAMDALQAGLHVFVEKPLSTNAQEAVDIVNLARARERVVGVGHQYRLCPSLSEARRLLADGVVGTTRLAVGVLSQPWMEAHSGPEDSWRLDPRISGGGILADVGDHLLDALLWTTGRRAVEVAAFQDRLESGLDVVSAACVRLDGDLPATLGLCGVSAGTAFELTYFGERGVLRATDVELAVHAVGASPRPLPLPPRQGSIDADFVAAVIGRGSPCCPAEGALDTVRLLEAIARSSASGGVARVA